PPPPGVPASATIRIMSLPGGVVVMTRGGAVITAVADFVELGWAVQVLRSGAVILMASSAASSGGSGAGGAPAAATGGSGASAQGRGTSPRQASGKPGKASMRV